jgi:O-acetyl-ADP-ribose deacetylase (regulator of RNase III)
MRENLHLIKGDAGAMDLDALMLIQTLDLVIGTPIASKLIGRAGEEVQNECIRIGTLPPGDAVVTSGGDLGAKSIIHCACLPVGGGSASEEHLVLAIRHGLLKAREEAVASLAVPEFSMDGMVFPKKRVAELVLSEVFRHLDDKDCQIERMFFVINDPVIHGIFEECIRSS